MKTDNISNEENGNSAKHLLGAVDWKGISPKDIHQIKYEVEHWYGDYIQVQEYKKLLGEEVDEPFENKFNKWIVDRIQMVLDRQ